MKFTKLLAVSTIAGYIGPVVPVNPDNPIANKPIYFSLSPTVGAFLGDENPQLSYMIFGTQDVVTNLKIDYYRTSKNVYYGAFSHECDLTMRSFELEIKDHIKISPIKLDINVTTATGNSVVFSERAIIEQPHYGKYIANGNKIEIPHVCLGVSLNSLINSETYDFTDTNEYITVDDYSRIDISTVTFDYYPRPTLGFKNAYLEIVDYENIYPNMTKFNDNIIRVPLKADPKSMNIKFKYNTKMYVNQSTLDMSDLPLEGYTETTSFYLPFGKQEKMNNNELRIFINESGFDLADITIPLRFIEDRNYFGFCSDSDYCIHGGVRR